MSNRYIPDVMTIPSVIRKTMGIPAGLNNALKGVGQCLKDGSPLTARQVGRLAKAQRIISKDIFEMNSSTYDQYLTKLLRVAQWRLDHA